MEISLFFKRKIVCKKQTTCRDKLCNPLGKDENKELRELESRITPDKPWVVNALYVSNGLGTWIMNQDGLKKAIAQARAEGRLEREDEMRETNRKLQKDFCEMRDKYLDSIRSNELLRKEGRAETLKKLKEINKRENSLISLPDVIRELENWKQ